MKLKLIQQVIYMSKLALFGLLIQSLLFTALIARDGYAQKSIDEIYVDIGFSNADISEIIKGLESKTEFSFIYEKRNISKIDMVFNYNFENESLGNILRKVAEESGLAFKRVNNNITVKEWRMKMKPLEETIEGITYQQKISGKVISEDKEPLPGVSILIKGTTTGTTTDINGNYSLNVPQNSILQYSYIGFITSEIEVLNQSVIDITLKPDLEQLEEVVVVGYGTQQKGELTVAVAQVKGETIQDIPKTSLTEALGGRAAGVDVINSSGAPGAGSKIRIRGSNSVNSGSSPLIVIDGFPVAASNDDLYSGSRLGYAGDKTDILSMLNPNDIESIEILKDAAATSIYGARGANGVIIISTKNGRTGTAGITVSANMGIQKAAKQYEMMNSTEFSNMLYDGFERGNRDVSEAFDPSGQLSIPTEYNTAWVDEIMRTGSIQDYNIAFNGSSEKTNYSGSVGFLDNKGIIKTNDYRRYSARFNADSKAWNSKLKFGINTNLSYVDKKAVSNQRVYQRAQRMIPNYPVRFPTGEFAGHYLTGGSGVDPYNELWGNGYGFHGAGGLNLTTPFVGIDVAMNPTNTARIIANGYLSIEPVKGLVIKSSLGTDLNFNKSKYLMPHEGPFAPTGGSLEHFQNQTYSWLMENTVTYKKTINKHRFTALLGQSAQQYYYESLGFAVEEIDPGNIFVANNPFFIDGDQFDFGKHDNLSEKHKFAKTGDWAVASYFGRLNYSFGDKYLITATVRKDGSSKFSEGNKWGVFPGVSAAWNMHNENFFNVGFINELKLRGSWGTVGNGNLSSYQSLALMTSRPAEIIGVTPQGTATWEKGLADPNLAWESTREINFGVDARIFSRLNVVADVYWKNTTDLLYARTLPYTSGFSKIQITNLGSLKNYGVELSFSGDVVQSSSGFNWFASLNMTHTGGQITGLPDNGGNSMAPRFVGGAIRSYINEPLGRIYGYDVVGIYNDESEVEDPNNPYRSATPGDYKFRDWASVGENGEILNAPDTLITGADRMDLGRAMPVLSLGFNNTFSYKGFDLTVFFRSSIGNKIYNKARRDLLEMNGKGNVLQEAVNRWTPENKNQEIQSAHVNRKTPVGGTDNPISIFVEDGSYLRLQNLTLGYTFPKSMMEKIGMRSIRLFTSMNNLFVLTNYSGLDPEISGDGGGKVVPRGVDSNAYPKTRLYSLGLNLSF